MWFPTHIRRHKIGQLFLTFATCTAGLTTSGCSSLPKLESVHSAAPAKIAADQRDGGPPVTGVFDSPRQDSRVAASGPSRRIVEAPQPFAWTTAGHSAGGRPIESVSLGDSGYRTLILGSLAGHDPTAIALTEAFARHLHENQIILGGQKTVIVHNPNPDGAATQRKENAAGAVLNRQFLSVRSQSAAAVDPQPEAKVILQLLQDHQPQRVIHIRTWPGPRGIVAANTPASSAAGDIAEWLDFEVVELPGQSREGTLERYLSLKESCEIITFAIPADADKTALWETYGDTLLNLLIDEDYQTRLLARNRGEQNSADRRGEKNQQPAPRP